MSVLNYLYLRMKLHSGVPRFVMQESCNDYKGLVTIYKTVLV